MLTKTFKAGNGTNNRISRWMMTLMITCFVILSSITANAQLTGTKNIPGDYATLAAAIADLNTQGVGLGGVTINLLAGNPETAPAGGYVIGDAGSAVLTSSSLANPVVIQGNGNVITAFSPQASGSVVDAIFKIIGADFVTISGFSMQENAANVTNTLASNDKTEFGVALFYVTTTDGAQNNTIQNNTISLSASYQNAIGIYSSTAHSATAPTTAAIASANSGSNNNTKVYGNTISNVANGIALVAGPVAGVIESGADVGGTSLATGNNITFGNNTAIDAAWAGFLVTEAGIQLRNVVAVNAQFNTIVSGPLTQPVGGILITPSVTPISAAITYTNTISNNNITLTETGTNAITGIQNSYGNATATHVINSNIINLTQSVSAAATVQVNGILAQAAVLSSTINNNNITISQSTSAGANSGQVNGIQNLPGASVLNSTQTITGNSVVIKQAVSGTGSYSGTILYVWANFATNAFTISSANISSNNFLTTGGTIRTSGTTYGVYHDYTYSNSMTLNNNTFNIDKTGAGSVNVFFSGTSGSSPLINITNCNVNITGTATAGQVIVFRENDGIGGNATQKNINNNIVNVNLPADVTTCFAFLSDFAGGSFSNNQITYVTAGSIQLTNLAANSATFGATGGSFNISNNTISLTSSLASGVLNGLICAVPFEGSYTVSNNTFTTLNLSAAAASAPGISCISVAGGANNIISGNKIQGSSTGAGTGSGTITGISLTGGTINNVFKNKIYDLSTSASGTATLIRAISASGGSNNNIYNNTIGFTNALTGVNSADAIRGISVTSAVVTSTANVYDNTVYLNSSSTGTNFGTTGIFHTASATATTARLDLRNNIVVNLSTPNGTGITSALRRSVAATYGNYAATSDRNLLYAGTPGVTRAILNDNGTAISSFATYQTTVATKDANSFTGEAGFTYSTPGSFFASLTGSAGNFLHLQSGIASRVESGGLPINAPLITDDYDGDTRNTSTPDIGADEFTGTNINPVITNVTVPTGGCTVSSHSISADVTVGAGTITSVTLNYNNGAAGSVAMTPSGDTYTASIPAGTPGVLVTWTITAVSSGGAITSYSGGSYKDDPLAGSPVVAVASVNPVCSGTPTSLSASVTSFASGQIGSGTVENMTNTNIGAFYGTAFGNCRSQILIKASELNAAGIFAGNLTGLRVNVTGGTLGICKGLTIQLASTNLNSIAGSFVTGSFTQVYTFANYNVVSGINTHTFSTPFAWDGVSNIIVDYCFSNQATGTASATNTTTATAFGSAVLYAAQGTTIACGISTVTGSSTIRPNISFVYSPAITTIAWSDGVSTVGNTNPLSVTLTSSTTYTASVTALSCSATTAPLAVTVNALPAAPGANGSTQCGTGVPTAFVTTSGGGGGFNWYSAQTGGTLLQAGGSSYSTSISSTQHFWVSEIDAVTGCESPRVEVVAEVTAPDPVLASVDFNNPCLNTAIQLSAANTASSPVNNYTYNWTANPSTGSGIPGGGTPGASIPVTPTAAGTYTYTVTAVDGLCTTTSTVVVTVKSLPVIVSTTASPSTICFGNSSTLTSLTNQIVSGVVNIGEQSTTIGGTLGNPYRAGNGVGNQVRTQLLVTAGELATAGLQPGNITSLAFTTTGIGGTMINFTIRMAATNATALTATFETPSFTTVFTQASFTAVVGLNTHTFQTPFSWNGTSNIVIDICQTNSVLGTTTVAAYTPAYNSNVQLAGSTTSCSGVAGTIVTTKPIMQFGGSLNGTGAGTLNWSWNPGSLSGNSVSASPISTTTYTVTATDPATTCSSTGTVTVTVNPLPATPSTNNSEQCGTQVPDASVSSNTGAPTPTFNWYSQQVGGALLQSSTSTTYTSPVSATTTFWVAELGTNGCESERASVTVTVTPPDPIVAHATVSSLCENSSFDLSVTQDLSNNTYNLTWSATPSAGSGIPSSVPGSLASPVTVTPTIAGTYTYTITGFDADRGCSITSTVVVTVRPNPSSVTAGASALSTCTGSTVNLTSSAQSNVGHAFPAYTTGFEGTFPPTNWSIINAGTGNNWVSTSNFTTPPPAHTGTSAMAYGFNSTQAANAWAISPGQSFIAGDTYTISFWYNTQSFGGAFPEKLKVTIANGNSVAAQNAGTILFNNGNLTNETYIQFSTTFVAPTTGTYYVGFNCYSNADENVMLIDDVSITGPTIEVPTFTWTSVPVGFTSTDQNPLNVLIGQTTTFSVVAHNSFGCSSDPVSVTVNAIPLPNAPVASNSSQCGLHIPTASVSTGGANGTFNWYDSQTGGTLLQAGGSTYNTAISSTTTFWVSENDGTCESLRTPVTVTVTTPPTLAITASGSTTFCLGGNVGLNAAIGSDPGYVNFAWTANPSLNSGLSAASGSTVTVTPTVAGSYTYTVVADDGAPLGCANTTSITVLVNPNPVIDSIKASPAVICLGSSSTLNGYSTLLTNGPTSIPATYCVPTQTGTSTITSVTFNTLSNTAVTQVSPFYNIYSNTTAVFTGTSYDLTVGASAAAIVSVWIDFDRNGSYDATEWTQVYTAATSGTISIPIPANAVPGLTGMRIRSRATGNANSATDACTGFGSGSTHDYAITIIGRNLQNPNFTYSWNPGSLSGSTTTVSPAATTTYTLTVTNPVTSCTSTGTVTVTVSNPVISIASQTNTCNGSSSGSVDLDATGGIAPYTYSLDGNITIDGVYSGLSAGPHTANVTDANGCTATTVIVTIVAIPRPTGVISGAAVYCGTATPTNLSIAVTGTGPWSGTLSDGTPFSGSASPITVSVTPLSTTTYTIATLSDNGPGCSALAGDLSGDATVTVNPVAANPTVTVIQPSCAVASGSITMTAPLGAGNSYTLDGTTTISWPTITFNGVASGNHTITVTNSFGCSAPASANVTINAQPSIPGAPVVTGIVNICPYIGTGDQITYTATATGNGTQTFSWNLPPNVNLISGAGTNTIVVTFNNGFASQNNKQIRVTVSNECGNSSQTIYYLLAQFPNTPNPISGPSNVCTLIGTASTATYITNRAAGANGYIWTTPANTSVTHPNSGINDTVIVVTFNPGFSGGQVTVTATNGCGLSGTRSFTITNAIPPTPSPISGPTNVCANIAPGGIAATYSVTASPFASSYTWTVPAGAIGLTGQGTNTISFTYPAGFTSGTITVTATNGCGTSGVRSLVVTKLNPGAPSNIDVIQTHFCGEPGGRVFTYTLAAMPVNATSVLWTVPTASGAILVSGQGTSSITVSYPDAAVSGTVTAQAVNNCAASTIRSVDVRLPACPPPGFAKAGTSTTTPVAKAGMEVKIFPNPTVSDFKLEVLTSQKEEINVRVLDGQGRLYRSFKLMPYQTIALGSELKAGSYIVEVRQGDAVKTTKVIKF